MTITQIKSLESGTCAWIGRHDIHVYCHAPMRRRDAGDGRWVWRPSEPEEARYCVVCPEAGLAYVREPAEWVTAVEAARLVDGILAGALPAVA